MGAILGVLIAAIVGWWLYERSQRKTSPMPGGLHTEITLPHETEWELYHNSISLCSRKLRICMEELALPYTSHPVDLIETGAYENVGRAFLAVNPAGLVPVLVHRGHPVYESHEEIVYAAEHAGARGAALLAKGSPNEAVIERWMETASLVGDDPTKNRDRYAGNCIPALTVPIFATMLERIGYRQILEGLLFHPQKQRPMLFLTLKVLGIDRLPNVAPAVRVLGASRRDMGRHLDRLDAHLGAHGGPWIAGGEFSLADVSWVVVLDRLEEVDWADFFWGDDRRPNVAAYYDRLKARPSYAAAIVAHRCEATTRGAARVREAKASNPDLRRALEDAA